MRLYLSSYRMGEAADELRSLLRGGGQALVISNALDAIPPAARADYAANVHDPHRALRDLGVESEALDLRDYFSNSDGLRKRLEAADLVWLVGGNAFILARAMARSGFAGVIRDLVRRDEIVYGGWSAGAVVAGRTLHGVDVMDAPDEVPEGYDPEVVWDGLGLIDFTIVPHYQSDHPEAAAALQMARHLAARGMPFRTLRDGQVLIADGGPLRLHEKGSAQPGA